MEAGNTYRTKNHGYLEIIDCAENFKVKVRFIKTGHEKIATKYNILKGLVKDPYYPTVVGIGYTGRYARKDNKKAYSVWTGMLNRCYAGNAEAYSSVKVCDEWHSFENFMFWFEANYKEGYDMDKDELSGDEKIYSPETCQFVSRKRNCAIQHFAKRKAKKIVSPSGSVITFFNMSVFARRKGLDYRNLISVIYGRRRSVKGYTQHKAC